MKKALNLSIMTSGLALVVGCSTEGGTITGLEVEGDGIVFSFGSATGGSGGGGGASTTSEPETFTDGTNTLIVNKVEFVMGQLELQRTDFVDCATNPDATTCGDFKIGPVLIDVPLGGLSREFVVDVDPGEYNAVEIQIHRLSSSDPHDADILLDRPEMDGTSIRVEGTFNGAEFVFTTGLDAFQGYNLTPPITIDEASPSTNVTVSFDLDRFFRDQSGALIDPATANATGENEELVEENIRGAIECFEDADEDGQVG